MNHKEDEHFNGTCVMCGQRCWCPTPTDSAGRVVEFRVERVEPNDSLMVGVSFVKDNGSRAGFGLNARTAMALSIALRRMVEKVEGPPVNLCSGTLYDGSKD